MSARAGMTHRERLVTALNHREPDRVPMDLGSSRVTTMMGPAAARLSAFLEVGGETPLIDGGLNVVAPPEAVMEMLDVDARGIWLGAPDGAPARFVDEYSYIDEWQVVRSQPPGSYYFDLVQSPLAGEITVPDVVHFRWPDPHDAGRTRGLRQWAERLRRETDYAIVLTLTNACVQVSQYLRGYQDWFADMAADQTLAGAVMDAVLDVNLAVYGDALAAVGDLIDAVSISDDVGTQRGPMVSPAAYRALIKPRHRRVFAFIHDRTDAKIKYHTCGSVYQFLGDFVDIGVDALNPVQVAAAEMDTARMKREWGAKLSFWGGVDTQHILPAGTVEDVRAEVRRRIEDLAPGGGYVLGPVHNVQPEVPPENVVALFAAGLEYGSY